MKRIFMFIAAVLMAASCKVVEADFNNPTTDEYISRYCVTLFSDKVSENLEYFYNAYYVARFVTGDAELKVSPEYDHIRTRITGSDGKYEFDYLQYEFQGNDFFAEGGICVISSGRWLSITIKNIGIGQWTMEVNDGTKFVFTVVEENAEGLVLDMSVSGVKKEESEYTAPFEAEGMEVDMRHKNIGNMASKTFFGTMEVSFLKAAQLLKTCSMTIGPGESIRCTIVDHVAD